MQSNQTSILTPDIQTQGFIFLALRMPDLSFLLGSFSYEFLKGVQVDIVIVVFEDSVDQVDFDLWFEPLKKGLEGFSRNQGDSASNFLLVVVH